MNCIMLNYKIIAIKAAGLKNCFEPASSGDFVKAPRLYPEAFQKNNSVESKKLYYPFLSIPGPIY
ncbi:MAG: hypothetical protein JWM28_1634 [Chitinophagaceae bacterium]|nr:hypothetical protein [Chitinophagaceae bacterium]